MPSKNFLENAVLVESVIPFCTSTACELSSKRSVQRDKKRTWMEALVL
jgi:hypothetical protein